MLRFVKFFSLIFFNSASRLKSVFMLCLLSTQSAIVQGTPGRCSIHCKSQLKFTVGILLRKIGRLNFLTGLPMGG